MIEKIKRPQQFNKQEMQIPRNIQELIQRYDLNNTDIRDYLDYIIKLFLPLTGGTMTGAFRIANGSTYGIQNANGEFIIRDHNNKNVTVDATGATLFLGWSNTTGIDILNGKLNIDSSGKLTYATAGLYAPNTSGIRLDQYGNIYTQQTMTSGNWRIQNGDNVPLRLDFSDNSLRTRGLYPQTTNTYDLGSTNYYWKSFYVGSVISSMGVRIPKNSSSSYYGLCNTDGKPIIRDHGNNNVTVDATGGTLFLGYENTTGLNFLSGAMTMTSSQFTSKNIQCDGWLVVGGTLRPNGNNSYTLGNSSNYWSNGYITKLYFNELVEKDMNAVILNGDSTNLYLGTASGSSGKTTNIRGNTVRLYAHSGGGVYLGSSGSTAITSDENLKDIFDIDNKYIDFFNKLKPINYIYKQNGHRKHFGFGARQVEQSLLESGLTTEDFAGILIDKDVTISADENGTGKDIHYDELYSLRYEEFIALNTLMIQKQNKEIEILKDEIKSLKKFLKERGVIDG